MRVNITADWPVDFARRFESGNTTMCPTRQHCRGFCEIDWELRMFSDAVFGEGAEGPSFLGDRAGLFKSSKLVKVNWQKNEYIDLYTRAFPLVPLSCASFHSLTAALGGGDVRKDNPSLKGCRLNDGSVNMHCFRRRGAHSSLEARPWLGGKTLVWHRSKKKQKNEFFHSVHYFRKCIGAEIF